MPPFLTRLLAVAAVIIAIAVAAPAVMPGLLAAFVAGGDASGGMSAPSVAVAPAPASEPAHPPGIDRSFVVSADTRGHYVVAARINGMKVDAIVDTGATTVALTIDAARRIGVLPATGDFTVPIDTANGRILAAPVYLSSIEVGDVRVDDVQALVLPSGALDVSLLGMSFLGRLSRYEATGGKLQLIE